MFVFILYTFQANKLCGILWFDPYFTSVSWKQIFELVHKSWSRIACNGTVYDLG